MPVARDANGFSAEIDTDPARRLHRRQRVAKSTTHLQHTSARRHEKPKIPIQQRVIKTACFLSPLRRALIVEPLAINHGWRAYASVLGRSASFAMWFSSLKLSHRSE